MLTLYAPAALLESPLQKKRLPVGKPGQPHEAD